MEAALRLAYEVLSGEKLKDVDLKGVRTYEDKNDPAAGAGTPCSHTTSSHTTSAHTAGS